MGYTSRMDSRTSILVDDSLWPLLRVTFPSVITNEQHKDLLERRLFYLQRRERHVSLIDMRQLRSLTFEQRELQAAFLRQQEDLMNQWSMGGHDSHQLSSSGADGPAPHPPHQSLGRAVLHPDLVAGGGVVDGGPVGGRRVE
ncbi:hypothetical protein ACN28S_13355 [Cystobacter fuscus]